MTITTNFGEGFDIKWEDDYIFGLIQRHLTKEKHGGGININIL
jgi:hypothetical protein